MDESNIHKACAVSATFGSIEADSIPHWSEEVVVDVNSCLAGNLRFQQRSEAVPTTRIARRLAKVRSTFREPFPSVNAVKDIFQGFLHLHNILLIANDNQFGNRMLNSARIERYMSLAPNLKSQTLAHPLATNHINLIQNLVEHSVINLENSGEFLKDTQPRSRSIGDQSFRVERCHDYLRSPRRNMSSSQALGDVLVIED